MRRSANAGEDWVDVLLGVRRLIHDGLREELLRTRIDENPEAFRSYLRTILQNLREERMVAFFMDGEGYMIAEETIAEGEDAYVLITPRRIFGRAMNLDARKILLAHNHPSGSAEPSRIDIEHTELLVLQAQGLGITIEDHLIVGRHEITSFRDRGLI